MKCKKFFEIDTKNEEELEHIHADYFAATMMLFTLIGLLIYNLLSGKNLLDLLTIVFVYIASGELYKYSKTKNIIVLFISILFFGLSLFTLVRHIRI